MEAKAQRWPAWLSRSFLIRLRVTLDFFPEALVMGEAPAYAFSPRGSAKRVLSSPTSASTRAGMSFAVPLGY